MLKTVEIYVLFVTLFLLFDFEDRSIKPNYNYVDRHIMYEDLQQQNKGMSKQLDRKKASVSY